MDLVTPGIGLIFWTTIIFGLMLLILKFAAWKPITKALDDRSKSIDDALKSAEEAREEMKSLKANNEKILAEAKLERDKIIMEANSIKDKIIVDAKKQANEEIDKLMDKTQKEITNLKQAAFEDIKNQVLDMSVTVAEKILKEELKDIKKQEKLVDDLIKQTNLN